MNKPKDQPTGDTEATVAPESRPQQPSPSERHPGKKPEEAESKFEDLQIRDAHNKR